MKKALALFLAAAMSCTLLAGCGQDNTTDTGDTAETSDLVYAVEAGSAGEAVATEKGWEKNCWMRRARSTATLSSSLSSSMPRMAMMS